MAQKETPMPLLQSNFMRIQHELVVQLAEELFESPVIKLSSSKVWEMIKQLELPYMEGDVEIER